MPRKYWYNCVRLHPPPTAPYLGHHDHAQHSASRLPSSSTSIRLLFAATPLNSHLTAQSHPPLFPHPALWRHHHRRSSEQPQRSPSDAAAPRLHAPAPPPATATHPLAPASSQTHSPHLPIPYRPPQHQKHQHAHFRSHPPLECFLPSRPAGADTAGTAQHIPPKAPEFSIAWPCRIGTDAGPAPKTDIERQTATTLGGRAARVPSACGIKTVSRRQDRQTLTHTHAYMNTYMHMHTHREIGKQIDRWID